LDKIILHSDMNNYFASVECIYDGRLKTVPMAVCGDPATRHGIVLAKNNLAKKLGIMTGESIYSAKQKVPQLTVVNADYSRYVHYAKLARKLYSEYSDEIIPYGLDEAWIDLTQKVKDVDEAVVIASTIRMRIKKELSLTASIGVSFNYIFSKLASDMKKPDATTVLHKQDLQNIIWQLPAFDMLFVGPATRKKLHKMNILTIGDVARTDPKLLSKALGKVGIHLWQFANGNDSSFNPKVPEDNPFKNIGNTITLPRDLTDETDILAMLLILTKTVVTRLYKHGLKAKCISMNFKYKDFTLINRQITLSVPTNSEGIIFMNAKRLFENNYVKNTPIRSLGVHVSNLSHSDSGQMSLFDMEEETPPNIKALIINLRNKLGDFNIEKSAMSEDQTIDINEFLK
jgi:DNA polymerase IV